ncbi:MAG: DUF418 domain-containing protein [Tannerellaceae bacterium]|nr:DUF418 domain-containing protein [Tannerellaceae bacterium]
MSDTIKNERLGVVDSLRGFALLAIVLLHNLEHYNLFMFPDPATVPEWLKVLDGKVWDATFFLLAGKAYATFSLLFGFSFYIQLRNARRRGDGFRGRFIWRMILLMLFAQLHALFYNGDILLLYATVGLILPLICNLKDRTIFILATICLLQPVEWIRLGLAYIYPGMETYGNYFYPYYLLSTTAMSEGTFLELLKSNITEGQLYSNLWQVEHGRLFQIPALFMFGILLGRKELFIKSDSAIRSWKKILIGSAIAFVPLYLLKTYLPGMIGNETALAPVDIIFPSYANFAFMLILVSSFTLLWFRHDGYKFQHMIIPYGKMSLTNYIGQSVIGITLYYGFGFALYKYTTATQCILIGLGIFMAQLLFSRWWLSRYRQGPLEYLWRKGTWIGKN